VRDAMSDLRARYRAVESAEAIRAPSPDAAAAVRRVLEISSDHAHKVDGRRVRYMSVADTERERITLTGEVASARQNGNQIR
jgi:hypothetical protein